MAKGKSKTAKIAFCGTVGSLALERVVCKRIPQLTGKPRFLHIEYKGGTWVLLDGLGSDPGTSFTDQMVFDRSFDQTIEDLAPLPVLTVRGTPVRVSKHIQLNLGELGSDFYYLDELPDGTWRIAYTQSFFTLLPHSSITGIRITENGDP